jgi:ankyrin repeat protein
MYAAASAAAIIAMRRRNEYGKVNSIPSGIISYREGGISPIHNAAMNGNLYRVETFLLKGVHPDKPYFDNETPLSYAVISNHYKVVEKLLQVGANPNCRNWYNNTPLHEAIGAEMTKLLISNGAKKVNTVNTSNETPLHTTLNYNDNGNFFELI